MLFKDKKRGYCIDIKTLLQYLDNNTYCLAWQIKEGIEKAIIKNETKEGHDDKIY